MRTALALVLVSTLVTLAGCGSSGPVAEPTVAGPSSASPGSQSGSPGLVDVGGRSLFLDCRGRGSPTVVLEAGLTGDHRTWEDVVPAVRPQTRVCSYDRANVGSSDHAAKPRTGRDLVDDLHTLMAAAGEKPPFVLVGFSFGGLVTQLYAASYPEDVAGMVLVDSNHPDEVQEFESHLTRSQIVEDRASVAGNSEGVDVFASFDEVRAAGGLPDLPLVVVTAGLSDGWPPGWNPRLFDRLRRTQQADLASMVPDGKQVFARHSHHDVPAQQPQLVAQAISTVISKAR